MHVAGVRGDPCDAVGRLQQQYGEECLRGKSVSYGDTLPHTVVGVCGEFQRTGRFLQRGI